VPVKIRDDSGLPQGIHPRLRGVQPSRPDPAAAGPSAGKPSGDRVELSDQARALHAAKEALSQLPEVRQDLVKDLRERVKAGTYAVPADKIAERMLGEGLFG
jgi:negative regulator of flagellin synthesis FlgM